MRPYLLILLLSLVLTTPSMAAPFPQIDHDVGICDPYIATNCLKPDSDGVIDTRLRLSTDPSSGVRTSATENALESAHVIKNSPGLLYGYQASATSVPGWMVIIDNSDIPQDGSKLSRVIRCHYLNANQSVVESFRSSPPIRLEGGAVMLFSTTSCFQYTASPTAFFAGEAY